MSHTHLTRRETVIELAGLTAAIYSAHAGELGFSDAERLARAELDDTLHFADRWDADAAREEQLLIDIAADWDLWADGARLDAECADDPEPDPWYEDADELQPAGEPPVDWESAYDYRD